MGLGFGFVCLLVVIVVLGGLFVCIERTNPWVDEYTLEIHFLNKQ